jgi:hypothetical protein
LTHDLGRLSVDIKEALVALSRYERNVIGNAMLCIGAGIRNVKDFGLEPDEVEAAKKIAIKMSRVDIEMCLGTTMEEAFRE